MTNRSVSEFARRYPGLVREYEVGQKLFDDKANLEFDFLVVEGAILEVVVSEDQTRRSSTLLFRRGDFIGRFGEGSNFVSHTSASCLARAVVLKIPETMFHRLLEEDAELRSLFMSSMVNMYHRLCDKFANIINLTPGQRVARFILRNAARDSSWEIHISTSELAQAVTTTRQTVSHVLADLRRDGIVETSYSRIKVLKPDGLKKYMGSVS